MDDNNGNPQKNKKQYTIKHTIAFFVVIALLLWGINAVFGTHDSKKAATKESSESKQVKNSDKDVLANKVKTVLDSYDKDFSSELASTGQGGLQGDIEGVKADSDDGVIVLVSTNFTDPGKDEGQEIARKIFTNICLDVPSLDTLYVTSTTSHYDSRSVYRSDYPGCKQ